MSVEHLIASIVNKRRAKYDIPFGVWFDPCTELFVFEPNPGDTSGGLGVVPTNRARIIFFTPGGSDTGPINQNITVHVAGVPTLVTYATYTRNTMAKCSALVRVIVAPAVGYGDWMLLPAQTLVMPLNGETRFGQLDYQTGLSRTYPNVIGTYDPAAMTDPTKWNKGQVVFDFNGVKWSPISTALISHSGHSESNVAILNITEVQPNASSFKRFYYNAGIHSNILLQRCIPDGSCIQMSTVSDTSNIAVVLTSSGTTATAVCPSAFGAVLKLAADAGQTITGAIFNATPTAYNGLYTLTYVDATHFTYTFAGTGGLPATGTTMVTLPADSYPDAICSHNIVLNQCGIGNSGQSNGAHAIGEYIAGPHKHIRHYRCLHIHGGFPKNGSRSAAPFSMGATITPITSITRVGGTVTAMTPWTTGLAVGGYVSLVTSGIDGLYQVTAITPGTSFTFQIDPTYTGTPLATAAWRDPAANGFSGDLGDPPDIYSHGIYIQEGCVDIRIHDQIVALDCVHSKLTGGPYVIENWVEIRSPMSFISNPSGNDGLYATDGCMTWPTSCTTKVKNHLQVFSQDMTPAQPDSRGSAPQYSACALGSNYINGLTVNNTNNSGRNRTSVLAILPAAKYRALYNSGVDNQHSISVAWAPTDISAKATVTTTWKYNVTDDAVAVPGGTNLRISDCPPSFQAGLATVLSRDIANTFRLATSQLASVPVGATDLDTEQNCLNYMLHHPQHQWASLIQTHFRQPIGR